MDQPERHHLSGYGLIEAAVRIERQDGGISGAGVAISPRHIATCAHVVLDALGLHHDHRPPPGAEVKVTVWDAGESRHPKVWLLPEWRAVASGDIALLQLNPVETDLTPACSQGIHGDQWQQQTVDVYGYPTSFYAGQWVRLTCHNAISDGHIQCSPEREGLSPGHSGGPVFTRGMLVGIARARRRFRDPDLEYDYIIPTAHIHSLLPALDGPLRQPYFALAEALRGASGQASPEQRSAVHKTQPHNIEEYGLQRWVRDWETRDVRLDFTPLLMLMEDRRRDTAYGQGPTPIALNNLNEALERQESPVFLLEGPPGSGKTTLLKRLSFDSCLNEDLPVPILIELANHRGASTPEEWLNRYWLANFPEMPRLSELSHNQELLWLLDGLNELPDETVAPRTQKIDAWRDWLGTQADRHRAIVSCRSADYLSQLDQVAGRPVPHLELQPLDLPKIAEFLGNRSALTPRQAEEAIQHIEVRDLVHLYNTPLLLTLLEAVLSPEGDFPDGRADLFSAFLCRLIALEAGKHRSLIGTLFRDSELRELARLETLKEDRAGARRKFIVRANPLFDALSAQAYQRQRTEYKGERQEVSFDRWKLEYALLEQCGEVRGGQILKAAVALSLLVQSEDGVNLRFRHQHFQEFFAARQLVKTQELALVAAPYRPEAFRESLESVRRGMAPWEQLPGVDRSGWEETGLIAAELAGEGDAFIAALAEGNLPLAGQCTASRSVGINIRSALAERLLARMRDLRVDLRARIAAGRALGEMEALEVLGYRAHRDSSGRRIAWLPPTAPIAAGDYTFGSQGDPDADDDEHRFTQALPAFRLGRYAVTNAEWSCFLEAGGYSNSELWRGEAARTYREKGANEGKVQASLWWRREHEQGRLDERLAASSMDLETQELVRRNASLAEPELQAFLAELRGQAQPVTEPEYWRASRYNNPLQPVVGISLYESLAYCRWLGELSGERYGVPHELQWEAAARGAGTRPRLYAWGDHFQRDFCNSRDAENRSLVGAATPVGLYEQGKTPDTGLYEMTGNVWEWTNSAWRDSPPYDTAFLDALDVAEEPRVVRGGAWNDVQQAARAADRHHGAPGARSGSVGFRMCVAPPWVPETGLPRSGE